MSYLRKLSALSRICRDGAGGIACRLYSTSTRRPSRCALVHVTLMVLVPLIGGEFCVICPRPKSKTCELIWHSAGRTGQSSPGAGGCLGDCTICAHAESESSAHPAASTKPVTGM